VTSPARRLLVIGDVHGEADALRRTLDRFAHTVDRVVCVGDLVDGETGVAGAVDTLRTLRARGVACVAGNHDRWYLMGASRHLAEALPVGSLHDDDLLWLATLPRSLPVDTAAGRALVAHGLGDDDFVWVEANTWVQTLRGHPQWERLRAGRFALHLGGHTHRPFARFVADDDPECAWRGLTFVNAGTLHRGHNPSACVVDLERDVVAWHPLSGDGFGRPVVRALPTEG